MVTTADKRSALSGFRGEVGGRLSELENRFPNRAAAADCAGVAKSTLQNWINGAVDPSFEGVSRICAHLGVSLDYLAFGQEKPENEIDLDRMEEIVEQVGVELEAQGIALRPRDFARLTRVVYLLIEQSRPDDRGTTIRNVLTLVNGTG